MTACPPIYPNGWNTNPIGWMPLKDGHIRVLVSSSWDAPVYGRISPVPSSHLKQLIDLLGSMVEIDSAIRIEHKIGYDCLTLYAPTMTVESEKMIVKLIKLLPFDREAVEACGLGQDNALVVHELVAV